MPLTALALTRLLRAWKRPTTNTESMAVDSSVSIHCDCKGRGGGDDNAGWLLMMSQEPGRRERNAVKKGYLILIEVRGAVYASLVLAEHADVFISGKTTQVRPHQRRQRRCRVQELHHHLHSIYHYSSSLMSFLSPPQNLILHFLNLHAFQLIPGWLGCMRRH